MSQKTYDRQTGKFLARISENLPPITSEAMQRWIDNPLALQKILKTLCLPKERGEVNLLTHDVIYIGLRKSWLEYVQGLHQIGWKIGQALLGMFDELPLAAQSTKLKIQTIGPRDVGFRRDLSMDAWYNAIEAFGLELCPAEVAFAMPLNDVCPLSGLRISVGMEPVVGDDAWRRGVIFQISKDRSGMWLTDEFAGDVAVDSHWAFVQP